MEGLLGIIVAILWIVVPAVLKHKQRESQQQAAREQAKQRALQGQPAAAEPAQQVRRAAASLQSIEQRRLEEVRRAQQAARSRPAADVSREGVSLGEGASAYETRVPLRPTERAARSEVTSTLTELQTSARHTVEASSLTGHAHEETSMTGLEEECPPELRHASPAYARAAEKTGAAHILLMDGSALQNSIVMAEILGPCAALRECE